MFIKLSRAYLCPGLDGDVGEHIIDNPHRCLCGSNNIVPLAPLLNKERKIKPEESGYTGCLLSGIPIIEEIFSGKLRVGR